VVFSESLVVRMRCTARGEVRTSLNVASGGRGCARSASEIGAAELDRARSFVLLPSLASPPQRTSSRQEGRRLPASHVSALGSATDNDAPTLRQCGGYAALPKPEPMSRAARRARPFCATRPLLAGVTGMVSFPKHDL